MADTAIQHTIGLLRSQGVRMTPQRIAIVEQIMTTPGYVVPLQVIEQVQARVPGVSPSTVYRTLERLEHLGVLSHVHLEQGTGYHQVTDPRHAHLTCSSCGKEQEVSQALLRRLEQSIQREHDFRPDFTHHPISGLCADCRAAALSPAAASARRRG
jgi:Fur family transcriptional regulator, ferric uptake regulator